MDKRQKQIAMIAGALVLAYLAYRYYTSSQAASTSTGAAAPDTSSSDYASLAGQEQSDVAALQGQNSQLSAQEQSDIAGLQGDLSGLTATVGGYTDAIDQITGAQTGLTSQIAAIASGVQKIDRTQTATVATHKGGPLYRYYKAVTGHAPPAHIATSSFIYQAYKSGVKATALRPSAPHPSSKNNQIAHPNANHTQQKHTKPASKQKAAAKPATRPPKRGGSRQLPKPKTRASGTRK